MQNCLYLFTSLLLVGCSSNELQQLKKQNKEFLKEIDSLNRQMKKIENAIVIPRKDFDKYIMPATFHPDHVKVNEAASFNTCLVLRKLPANIKCEWISTQEPMNLESEGLLHTVTNMYSTKGNRSFDGKYNLTFPDGEKMTLNWRAGYEVTDKISD